MQLSFNSDVGRLLGMVAILMLSVGLVACGEGSKSSSANKSASAQTPDRDNDSDHNDDDNHILYYGHAPTAAEKGQIVALVTAYYAASAVEDGAKACKLLMPFVAESVVESIGHNAGLRGNSCSVVMSKLFKQHHALLSGESASLKLYTVRVNGGKALTVLSFSNLPEVRQLTERLDEKGEWRVLDLLDGILE